MVFTLGWEHNCCVCKQLNNINENMVKYGLTSILPNLFASQWIFTISNMGGWTIKPFYVNQFSTYSNLIHASHLPPLGQCNGKLWPIKTLIVPTFTIFSNFYWCAANMNYFELIIYHKIQNIKRSWSLNLRLIRVYLSWLVLKIISLQYALLHQQCI